LTKHKNRHVVNISASIKLLRQKQHQQEEDLQLLIDQDERDKLQLEADVKQLQTKHADFEVRFCLCFVRRRIVSKQ
jgi:ABC-type molybdate transport system substrate-binding protein